MHDGRMTTVSRPRLRPVLANAGYRRLFAAQTISRWGDTLSTVALVVLVFQLTGSGLGVSGAVIAEILPVLLLAPIAGAVVDRLPRVQVMVVADLWRAAMAAVLPLVDHHLAAVYAIAFGLSAGAVFFNPAAASVLPAIVGEDELVAANSGLWSAAVVSQIALAPAAGALVAAFGVAPAFWLNAASFAISAAILAWLRPARAQQPAAAGSWARRIAEGARLLAADRLLRLLAAVQLLAALSAGATSALLVILAEHHLGTGPGGFGLMLGAIGAGAALGPLLLARLTSNPRRPALVFGPYLLRGAVDLILATTRDLPVAMAALGLYGVGTSTGMVTYTSLLQAEVPPQTRGRVFAGFDMIWQTGRLISLGLGGLAADTLGIQAVYLLGGALLLLAGSLGLAGLQAVKGLHPSPRTRRPT
jgi:MFS family permease